MNIYKENVDSLNAILKINILAADYQGRIDSVLSDYRKKADMPGFRKGKIPMGVIIKKYGLSVKVEEINKLLSESISKFIANENLDILGNPLPKELTQLDWNQQKDFNFEYELGLSPVFDLELSKKNKLDYYHIKADKATVEKYADDIAKRYGKMTSPDKVEAKDLVYGTFKELEEDGSEKVDGISNQASVSLDFLSNKKKKAAFIGAEKGSVIVLDLKKDFDNDTDAAAMINVDKDVYANLTTNFNFTIDNISRMVSAEFNLELFDKVYGEGIVKNEKEFRAKVTEEVEKMFVADSDRKFQNDAVDFLIQKTSFDLPEDFLKRWMQSISEKPVTIEEIEKDFEGYKKSLKWQIIENKIATENKLSVSKEEALLETKKLIKSQMAQYGQIVPEEVMIDQYAQKVLANKDEEKNIYDRVFASKLTVFFKENFKMNLKEISHKDFVKQNQR
ncbi:MAG: trigger factor [Flavobacteriales bacterium]|nr:trigger factor [Flavobacteriales bacterium]|tara:strand:- start:17444 stop:18790 length:1347 start_codon:yes stop_codon:yes gene_type:complete